ncbi:hypothetical protein [Brumicola pallidula]|uniref:Uncharacterized protein n=1 Tax=Brumicola pallidula DSM 14239 = ACAM 615 TaxID=1121922 RepID=K6Z2G5_9ALTE|nr:hypothetical protein [Glaciecola pallidula]GAC30386.1 hypothetical protein GPAL_3540 [Glaciecola pallidula DSM 14239 = ACAM 615]
MQTLPASTEGEYGQLDEIKFIDFVQKVASDKVVERAILKSSHHSAHDGVNTVIWSSS